MDIKLSSHNLFHSFCADTPRRAVLTCHGVHCAISASVFLFLAGLCIRPTEIALLVGSHGPTMNVYIAKMTVPDPCTAIVPIEPWPVHYSQT